MSAGRIVGSGKDAVARGEDAVLQRDRTGRGRDVVPMRRCFAVADVQYEREHEACGERTDPTQATPAAVTASRAGSDPRFAAAQRMARMAPGTDRLGQRLGVRLQVRSEERRVGKGGEVGGGGTRTYTIERIRS